MPDVLTCQRCGGGVAPSASACPACAALDPAQRPRLLGGPRRVPFWLAALIVVAFLAALLQLLAIFSS
jgi:hypothetical protein